jgi:hypothetical protein
MCIVVQPSSRRYVTNRSATRVAHNHHCTARSSTRANVHVRLGNPASSSATPARTPIHFLAAALVRHREPFTDQGCADALPGNTQMRQLPTVSIDTGR